MPVDLLVKIQIKALEEAVRASQYVGARWQAKDIIDAAEQFLAFLKDVPYVHD